MIDAESAARYCGQSASQRLKIIAALALAGGAVARTKLRRFPLGDIVLKGPRDYQTEVDRDVEQLIADGIVHGVGVFSGVIAATVLIVLAAVFASTYEIVTVSVYAAGLLAMLGFSAAYNLWPVSRRKWILRRFDHSAIYVLIAATYTPIFAQLQDRVFAMSLLAGVWGVAAVGITVKLAFPGRFDRLSVGLYLAMTWIGPRVGLRL